MEDSTLLKISLSISILGLIALSLFISIFDPSVNSLEDLGGEGLIYSIEPGEVVNIKGKVKSIRDGDGYQMISIEYHENITMMLSGSTALELDDDIEVMGELDEYRGRRSIKADLISS